MTAAKESRAAHHDARGVMIVCDGSNGAGKSTLIERLRRQLEACGQQVIVTREPGGTPVGEKIREILLSPDTPEMSSMTELMLFGAARAQHLHEKILPALKAGKVVLCDRFDSATISFQHYARGIDLKEVRKVNDLALGGFRPDLYLILDLAPELGLERVKLRGAELDRLEAEQLAFLHKARDGFLKQAQQAPERFKVLDAARDIDAVTQEALIHVGELIPGILPTAVVRP